MFPVRQTWNMRIEENKSLEACELCSIHPQLTDRLHGVTEQLNGGGAAADTAAGEQLLLVKEAGQLSQGEQQQLRPGVLQQLLLVVAVKLLE